MKRRVSQSLRRFHFHGIPLEEEPLRAVLSRCCGRHHGGVPTAHEPPKSRFVVWLVRRRKHKNVSVSCSLTKKASSWCLCPRAARQQQSKEPRRRPPRAHQMTKLRMRTDVASVTTHQTQNSGVKQLTSVGHVVYVSNNNNKNEPYLKLKFRIQNFNTLKMSLNYIRIAVILLILLSLGHV